MEEFRESPDVPLEVGKGETPDSYITRSLAAYKYEPAAVRTARVNLLVPFGLDPASLEEMRPLDPAVHGFSGLLRICEMIVALDRYIQNFCGFTQSGQDGDLERSLQDCPFDLSSGTMKKITAVMMPVVERFNENMDDSDNKAAFLDLIDMQDRLYDFLRLSGVIVKITGNEALDAIRYLISASTGVIGKA
jgi:hypothetical protein